jgi:hypothetical protein
VEARRRSRQHGVVWGLGGAATRVGGRRQ